MARDADKVVGNKDVLSTIDYGKFKVMEGNRNVDPNHVKRLTKLMLENGNLTYEFPIVVDKDGYVVDGQHRLEALRSLGWEVGYIIEETATIDTVRAINRGNRNWSWRDIAQSYANLGNEHYAWFLQFVDTYDLRFSPALELAGGKYSRRNPSKGFQAGEFMIPNKAEAHDLAKEVNELQAVIDNHSNDLCHALIVIVRSPAYNHDRMLQKMKAMGDRIPAKAKRSVYLRELEDLYNFGYPEDNKARLF